MQNNFRYLGMERFDVIIFGAGAAGLMAAKVLCEAGKKICILETTVPVK